MKLGTIIANYKFRRKNLKSNIYDIDATIKRLEDYQKYREKLRFERHNRVRAVEKKTIKQLKKKAYQKHFSIKPVHNPYINMYQKMHPAVDPKLIQRYRSNHIYSLYEFRHLLLPNSGFQIKCGHAWSGLIKAWTGYKISKKFNNVENMIKYASATQKWAHYLEAPMFPDFPDLSMTAAGYKNAKILKDEYTGDH